MLNPVPQIVAVVVVHHDVSVVSEDDSTLTGHALVVSEDENK